MTRVTTLIHDSNNDSGSDHDTNKNVYNEHI